MSSPTFSDISSLIAIRKKRAELVFKKGYLLWKASSNEKLIQSIDSELESAEAQLNELEKKLDNVSITFPDQEKLDQLSSQVSSLDPEKLYKAMESKEGEVFELLKERGELLKNISERIEEVARLNLLIQKLKGKEKKNTIALLKNRDNFSEDSILKIKDKKIRLELFKLFSRIGLPVSKENLTVEEEKVVLGSKAIWVPAPMAEKINDLNKKLEELSKKIQYQNAQKQIKNFSDNEEKEFQSMQFKYLSLLKEQDKILDNFGEL